MGKRKGRTGSIANLFSRHSGFNFIPGLGTGGVFFQCKPDDDSLFCKFSMVFKIIMMVVALFAISVMVYSMVKTLFKLNKSSPFKKIFGGKR
tara:strand:+ start:5601 stop:5876 length:276 start_codon:yes stop_codon:yes gene_type:complete